MGRRVLAGWLAAFALAGVSLAAACAGCGGTIRGGTDGAAGGRADAGDEGGAGGTAGVGGGDGTAGIGGGGTTGTGGLGPCACSSGTSCCGDVCANTTNDVNHCGGCDVKCGGAFPDCIGSICRQTSCEANVFCSTPTPRCCGNGCCASDQLCCFVGTATRPTCVTPTADKPSCPPN